HRGEADVDSGVLPQRIETMKLHVKATAAVAIVGGTLGTSPRTLAAAQDTLTLADAYDAAISNDPRAAEFELLERSLDLRLRNLGTEWLPSLSVAAEAQHQSEVTSFEIPIPGVEPPRPPKDRYQATLNVDQLVYEGGALSARGDVARAEAARDEAELAARLYDLRTEVDAAYFAVLDLQERGAELALLATDLEARLAEAREQVAGGVALPGEAAALEAELLEARQQRRELEARRAAALAVLEDLAGAALPDDARLALPALSDRVAATAAALGEREPAGRTITHPELARLEAERALLEERGDLIETEALPRVSAFGQAGYGRPGLDMFGDQPDTWWLAGVRLRWTPWEWNARDRERARLELRQGALDAERRAFLDRLERAVADERALIDALRAGLATGRRIVALREQIEAQQLARLREGVILPSVYVDARTDVTEARVALRRRRVEIARLQAQYLTMLGVRVR
ncbi:MAG: TolC family protein, partial [Longimicrobiales bacterium]